MDHAMGMASNYSQMVFVSPGPNVFPSPQFIPQQPQLESIPVMLPPIQLPASQSQFDWSQQLVGAVHQFQNMVTQQQQPRTMPSGSKFEYFTDQHSTRVMYSASQNGIAELNNAPDFVGEVPVGCQVSPPEDACVFHTKWSKADNLNIEGYTAFIKETQYHDPSVASSLPKMPCRSRSNSIVSYSSVTSDMSVKSKGELAHEVKADIVDFYSLSNRYKGKEGAVEKEKKEGLRGDKVVRVKCCTIKALENICDFLEQLDDMGLIRQLSCPLSRKKGGHVNGFQCYIMLKREEDIEIYKREYERFQEVSRNCLPKKIEHNPRSCAQKKADEERKLAEELALRAMACSPSVNKLNFQTPEVVPVSYSPMPGVMESCFSPCA